MYNIPYICKNMYTYKNKKQKTYKNKLQYNNYNII